MVAVEFVVGCLRHGKGKDRRRQDFKISRSLSNSAGFQDDVSYESCTLRNVNNVMTQHVRPMSCDTDHALAISSFVFNNSRSQLSQL